MLSYDDLHTSLKSIEHKLSGVESRLIALDNKFENYEKKMIDVILQCLNTHSRPYCWDQSTNLFHDVGSRPMHDTIFEQKVKLEKDLLTGGSDDPESNYDPIFYKENGAETDDNTQEINDNFELILYDDGPSIQEDQMESESAVSTKPTKLKNHRGYGKLNRFLDTISNRMKQNENHRKSFQSYMCLFTSGLMKKLRAAYKLFDKMYSSHIISGNYFDTPTDLNYDEYNLTVILKLPFDNENTVHVTQSPEKRGYCRLNVNIDTDDQLALEFKTQFVNKGNFIRVNEFYEWFNQIVIEHFNSSRNKLEILKKNNENLTFQINHLDKSSTGVMIKIHVPSENLQFSIDIGVGMEFDRKHAYCNEKIPQCINTETWIATAKSENNPNYVEWLCSYYTIERKILQDKCKVVPLIRIFKQFCNVFDVSNLNTYFIENIFLWEIAKQEDAKQTEFWTSSLASLFLHMIDIILRCLEKQSIPYFWDQSINLLHKIDSRPMYATIFNQKLKLEKELLNGVTNDSESNFDSIFYNKERKTSASTILKIDSDNPELISLQDVGIIVVNKKSNGIVKQEALDFFELLTEQYSKSPEAVSECGFKNSSSISLKSQEPANGGVSKKPKKGLYASQVLEFVGNFIQVTDRIEYIQHYNAVIKFLINELKTDDTFKHIFKGEVMAGSYRDGLKISKPNEFDTIMRLSFSDKSNLLVERYSNVPTHCTIKLIEYDSKAKPYLKQFLNPEGYLLQDVIIIWLLNLFRRILKPHDENGKIIQIGNHSYQYSHSINGPAFTFKITVLDTDIKFDMDLVPAIPFNFTHWVASRSYPSGTNQINWIAVPKPPKQGIQRNNRSFTCSYAEMEKHILHDINQAKNLIRIFKKLRDTQQLKYLKSYYIKTIFLWQFDNTTIQERKTFWSRSIEVLFVDMFKIILNHIQNRELPFYWEPTYNMFTTIPETKLKSWDVTMRGIFSRLESIVADNPKGLLDIILNPEEKKLIECKHEAKLCIE